MIILMKEGAKQTQIQGVLKAIEDKGYDHHSSMLAVSLMISVNNDNTLHNNDFETLEGVSRVLSLRVDLPGRPSRIRSP